MPLPVLFTRQMLGRLFGDKEPRDVRAMEKAFKTVVDNDNAIATSQIEGDSQTANLTQQQKSDYIDFDLSAPVLEQNGRVHWNNSDNTLNIGHGNGVVQQVGQEVYAYGYNDTGATLENGTLVAYGGVTSEGRVKFVKFNADGSMDVHKVLGVTTETILAGQTGLATSYGLVRDLDTIQADYFEFWTAGQELYADASVPGRIAGYKPLTPNQIVNVGYVTIADAVNGVIFVDFIKQKDKYYGEFSTTTQSPSAANSPTTLYFTNTEISHGVVLEGLPQTQIKVENSGLYLLSFNVQVKSTNASVKDLHFWFAKNGTNIANSSAYVSIKDNGTYVDYTNSNFFRLAANDYIQIKYATTDTNITLAATSATSYSPSAPACLLRVTQVQQ